MIENTDVIVIADAYAGVMAAHRRDAAKSGRGACTNCWAGPAARASTTGTSCPAAGCGEGTAAPTPAHESVAAGGESTTGRLESARVHH
jgi:hypothetical protein